MTTSTHAPALPEAEAMAAYRAIVSWLNDTYGEHLTAAAHPVRQGDSDPAWYGRPVLVADFELWHDPTAWAVVWEGGPFQWPEAAVFGPAEYGLPGDPPALPPGVKASAFCSFAVSLYRDTPVEGPR